MSSIAAKILAHDLAEAHKYLLQMMGEVTHDIAQFQPPGTANPIAGTYAHLIFSEDFFTHFFLKKTKPFFESTWKDKTGISELQPTEWVTAYPAWLRRVQVDMTDSRPYAEAVFAMTESYIETLTDEILLQPVDLSMFGMGESTVGHVIASMITGHCWSIMGEIAVLKGIQGLKGYPF